MVAYESYIIAVMTWINVVLFNALVISIAIFCYIEGMIHCCRYTYI